jgi:hypothetical protein
MVVHRYRHLLPATKVTFCRLNGRVAEQELDLFQVATRGPAELRASAAEVVGRDGGKAERHGMGSHHVPDGLLRQTVSLHPIGLVNGPEEPAV